MSRGGAKITSPLVSLDVTNFMERYRQRVLPQGVIKHIDDLLAD